VVYLVDFSIFAGVRVASECVLIHARTHTQITWVLDVSPGAGWTPGEPEESKSIKRSMHVDRICVQSTFVYTSAGLRVLII